MAPVPVSSHTRKVAAAVLATIKKISDTHVTLGNVNNYLKEQYPLKTTMNEINATLKRAVKLSLVPSSASIKCGKGTIIEMKRRRKQKSQRRRRRRKR